jgi:ribosomal protein S17E
MDNNQRIELYKNIYNNQITRKDDLKGKLLFPSGILLLFMSLANYIFSFLSKEPKGVLGLFLLISFTLFIYNLMKSLFYIFKSWKGYDYAYLPKSEEVEAYHDNVTKNEFETFLINKYTESNDKNFKHNKELRENLLKIQKQLIYALIAGFLSVFLIHIDKFIYHSVNIINSMH